MFPRKPKPTESLQLPGENRIAVGEKRYATEPAQHALKAGLVPPSAPAKSQKDKNPIATALQKLALNRFAGAQSNQTHKEALAALTQPVLNPSVQQWGEAYHWVIKGDALRLNEDAMGALAWYRQAAEVQPQYKDAWMGLGHCYEKAGDALAAVKAFKQALRLNAFDVDVRLALAKALQGANRWSEAARQYQRVIAIEPDHQEGRFQWALGLELQGDLAQATTLYETIVAADEECLPAINNLGSLYLRLGEYTKAEVCFKRLMDAAPEFHRGFLGLAITLDRDDRGDEALFYYRRVLALKSAGRNTQFITQRISELESVTRSALKRIK
ncbi:MAG: tetratricopeptide repeat protein [Vampirovibrionales bacterium]|nr:tetratricopeptide repeat protein [Vampirovibrionales bacterium]